MIEALRHDDLMDKVGGRFKLTALIQRRWLQLLQGARPMVEVPNPRSMEAVLREHLTADSNHNARATNHELEDHLSLLSRWFYGRPRLGEVFFAAPDWPFRRMIRACSRLLAPPAAESSAPPANS